MEVAPPVATSARPVATTFRPCAPATTRPAAALCSDAASRISSAPARPSTARGGSAALSARRTLPNSTAAWSFLDPAVAGANPCVRANASLRHRPATSRSRSTAIRVVVPKRPATARSETNRLDTTHVRVVPVAAIDTRVISEAARRECEHEQYSDPLHGKSVEPRVAAIAARSAGSVVNAVNRHEALCVKAFHARACGDYEYAIACYTKAVALEPSDDISRFQLAVALERTGRYKRALAVYGHVLAQQPASPFAHYNVANILVRLDRVSAAVAHFTSAIALCDARDPQRIAFYRARGAAYRMLGDFENASRDFAHYHAHRRGDVDEVQTSWSSKGDPVVAADSVAHSRCEYQAAVAKSTTCRAARLKPNRVVYNADALYAAPATLNLEQTEGAYDTWTRRRVFETTRRTEIRSGDDVLMLMDALQKVFPLCAVLWPAACTALCAKVVGMTNVRAGTPLCLETMRGSHVFFVYRGRVATYKTIGQHIGQVVTPTSRPNSSDDVRAKQSNAADAHALDAAEAAQRLAPTQSYESVYAALGQTDRDDYATLSTALDHVPPITQRWTEQQMELRQFSHGDVLGFQGRHLQDARTYSAVVVEDCDILALAWQDLADVEQLQRAAEAQTMARFLRTVPAFHDVPVAELLALSMHAKRIKVIGSRVVCSEGQFVDGLFVVHHGEACQLASSDLPLPVDHAIAFTLSGAFAVAPHAQAQMRAEFFAQLEFADDALAFAHVSAAAHGFLPHDFISTKVQQLNAAATATAAGSANAPCSSAASTAASEAPTTPSVGDDVRPRDRQVTARSLPRGSCFVASSAWLPPRRSQQTLSIPTCAGVAHAKSALVTHSSADLLFFTSADVIASLSIASRTLLQRNTLTDATQVLGLDMLEQLAWTQRWTTYKTQLVAAVVKDKTATRRRNTFESTR